MLNKEKFKEEIFEIACDGDSIAVSKDREHYDVPDAIERLLPEETHEEDEFKITIEKL